MNRLFASVFRARTTDEQAQQTPSYSFGERNARLLNWKLQFRRSVAGLICCALFGSYAYFWQARGWNSASRLMLTYALGDRGTVSIDGLQEQTGDRAFLNGHFYCDKPPGQSFLGLPFYLLLKPFGVSHSVGGAKVRYWWPDYVLTLATSGIFSAMLGVLLYAFALQLGCQQWPAALVALAYGLATPAWPLATQFVAHQIAAFLLFSSFLLLARCERNNQWPVKWMFAAGILAGYAVITDYPAVFTAAGLGVYALWARCPLIRMIPFAMSAAACAIFLAGYNSVAFGGPFELGYFHESYEVFREIYSADNPVGLTWPSVDRAARILFSASRGLIWYAPVVVLAPVGIWLLWGRRHFKLVFIVLLGVGSYFLVNASHPTWGAGASTGPRYMLASLPFLMIPVAASVSGRARFRTWLLGLLALAGFVVCGSCTATVSEGSLPSNDLFKGWGGEDPLRLIVFPDLVEGRLSRRNLGNLIMHGDWENWGSRNWVALLPLLEFQLLMVFLIVWQCRQATRFERSTVEIIHDDGGPRDPI